MEKKIKLGFITYNVPHRKSQEIFLRLIRDPEIEITVFVADFKTRKGRDVLFQHRPSQNFGIELSEIAKAQGIKVYPISEMLDFKDKIDYAMVGAANLLPDDLVTAFRIINCHPGLIPASRGLDSFKWAVLNDVPIGNTIHFIDTQVDSGEMLHQEITPLYKSDSIETFAARHYMYEINIMSNFKQYLKEGSKVEGLEEKDARMRMKYETEEEMLQFFKDSYKDKFAL